MSGQTGMFKLKPHFDFSQAQLDLPTCMFKMPNIQGESSAKQDDPAVAALEQRQDMILQNLQSLESEVAALATKIGSATNTNVPQTASSKTAAASSVTSTLVTNCVRDIVIYANPNNPPYSLLIIYELLKQQYRCMAAVHVHSSVKSVPDKLLQYFGQNGRGTFKFRNDAQLSLTLIWKNVVNGPEMMVAPNTQTPIQGEVNIARYLARLVTPAYDAGDIISVSSIDNYLDLASSAVLNGSSKEKAAAVRTLNSSLGKRNWLVGSSPTVADFVFWSALHQTGQNSSAPSNVQKWLKGCAALNEFRTVNCVLNTA